MKTVWINQNPKQVDLEYLENRLKNMNLFPLMESVPSEEKYAIEMGKKADIIVSASEPWNRRTLSEIAGQGKFIQRYGTGMENIDIAVATELKIPVANSPGANATAVAETALFHLLNVARRFSWSIEGVRQGIWPRRVPGNEIDYMTVGLIGFGNIARNLARMLSGFDCKILAYDSYIGEESRKAAKEYGVKLTESMEEVFRNANAISLHIPLNDSTSGIINKNLLSIMKPNSILVNTCRGGVVCEKDLIAALRNGTLRGVGLDVLTQEPPESDNPLISMENVYVTTHVGAATVESELKSQKIIADAIEQFIEGKVPFTCLNPIVFD